MKIYVEDGIEFELVKKTKSKDEAKRLRSEIAKKGYYARVRHFYRDGKVIGYGILKSLKSRLKDKPKKEQKLTKEQRMEEYRRKEAIEVAKAMKKPIKDIKWNIQYHKEKTKEYEKEVEKKPTYFNYESLSHHRHEEMIYLQALSQKKRDINEKNSKLADKLHEKYGEDNYGFDYPDLEQKVQDILMEKGFDEDKAWKLVIDIVVFHEDYLNLHLGTINWRRDLLERINDGEYPELKGKFIPQLSYVDLCKKDFINIVDDIAEDFRKEQGIVFTKSEINAMKKELRRFV